MIKELNFPLIGLGALVFLFTTETVLAGQRTRSVTRQCTSGYTRSGTIAASPGQMNRTVIKTGPAGNSRAVQAQVTKTDTGYARSVSRASSVGYTSVRSSQGVWDSATNTWVRQVNGIATGVAGGQVSRSVTVTAGP